MQCFEEQVERKSTAYALEKKTKFDSFTFHLDSHLILPLAGAVYPQEEIIF